MLARMMRTVSLVAILLLSVSPMLYAMGDSNRDIIYRTELKKVAKYRECVTKAAVTYGVPEWILMAVIRHENGPLHGYLTNPNGTKDYGVTCINDVRLQDFKDAGIEGVTAERIMEDPCFAIYVTSYLLKKEYLKEHKRKVKKEGSIWLVATANYHYHYKGDYPKNHNAYKEKIMNTLERFKTRLK